MEVVELTDTRKDVTGRNEIQEFGWRTKLAFKLETDCPSILALNIGFATATESESTVQEFPMCSRIGFEPISPYLELLSL